MSIEITSSLEDAVAEMTICGNECEESKNVYLAALALHVPLKLLAYAKRVAVEDATHTLSLGADGVKALRRELDEIACTLAEEVRSAAADIKWPTPTKWEKVASHHLNSALFAYLYPKTGTISALLISHGYGKRIPVKVLPQHLYSARDLEAEAQQLIECLKRSDAARRTLAMAQRNEDNSAARDLWGD
ncbi:hypothetical protein [Arthrobacter woluwensis]|uniref:hypothetical protein n=1 Tax=Arthrobacter woluwensis TaxID=156980 RepID=UPI003816E05B